MTALSDAPIQQFLTKEPDWSLLNGKLERVAHFEDFLQAMIFVNKVARMAESAGHHPDIDIRYNTVILGLVTHDAGGITERDLSMARELSRLL